MASSLQSGHSPLLQGRNSCPISCLYALICAIISARITGNPINQMPAAFSGYLSNGQTVLLQGYQIVDDKRVKIEIKPPWGKT
jgi:hypothetical protein